jgi:hypothetical protein
LACGRARNLRDFEDSDRPQDACTNEETPIVSSFEKPESHKADQLNLNYWRNSSPRGLRMQIQAPVTVAKLAGTRLMRGTQER